MTICETLMGYGPTIRFGKAHATLAILAVLAVFGMGPAQASQADLRDAYGAYQEAAAEGDVHAALPHAEACI